MGAEDPLNLIAVVFVPLYRVRVIAFLSVSVMAVDILRKHGYIAY
jgi:hypothetical protein